MKSVNEFFFFSKELEDGEEDENMVTWKRCLKTKSKLMANLPLFDPTNTLPWLINAQEIMSTF